MKRKIAAIFAADVAGYSRLVAEDEEETLRRLQAYRAVIDEFIASSSGRIFNTAGDAVLAEFASAVEAVRCAIDIQESLRTRNRAYPPSRQMNFRIGITIGDVVERDGDLLGDGVNIARDSKYRAGGWNLRIPHGVRASRQQALGAVCGHRRATGQKYSQSRTRIHCRGNGDPGMASVPNKAEPKKKAILPLLAALALVAIVAFSGGEYSLRRIS